MMQRKRNIICGTVFLALCGLVFVFNDDPWSTNRWRGVEYLTTHIGNLLIITSVALALVFIPVSRRALERAGSYFNIVFTIPTHWFLAAVALSLFFISGYVSVMRLDATPHIADGQAQYIQAKIFAMGKIYLPVHPLKEFFHMRFMFDDEGRYYGMYPPGFSLILAVGMLLSQPWIINPLLAALTVVAVYFLAKELGNYRTGRIAAMLTLLSSFIIFMSASYMNNPLALLMTTSFILFYLRLYKYRSVRDGMYAGVALGILGITRTQCVAWYALFFVPHIGFLLFKDWRGYIKPVVALGFAGFVFVVFFLIYNWITTGDPLMTGYQKMNMTLSTFWHGYKPHNPYYLRFLNETLRDINRLAIHFAELNRYLFAWHIPSLTFAMFLYVFAAPKKHSWLLMMIVFCTCIGNVLYNYYGFLFGPRYFYECSGVLIVLSALGVQRIAPVARQRFHLLYKRSAWRGLLTMLITGLTIASLWGHNGQLIDRYDYQYWEGNYRFYLGIKEAVRQRPAVVFVATSDKVFQRKDEYRFVFFTLPASEDDDIIFARDLGEIKNDELLDYYASRHAYIVDDNNIRQIR